MGDKILYPFSGILVGGSYVSASLIAKAFNEWTDYNTTIVLPGEGPNAELFVQHGLKVDFLNLSETELKQITSTDSRNKTKAFKVYCKLHAIAYRYLKKNKPDIIHINDDKTLIIWGLAAKRLKIPVIWHVRQEKKSVFDPIRLFISDYIIFVSDFNRKRFNEKRNLPPNRTVYNTVDINIFKPGEKEKKKINLGLDPELPVVGFVGNWINRKRPEWFIESAIELLAEGYNAYFILIGEDLSGNSNYSQELMLMVKEKNMSDNIISLGFRSDIANIMQAFDIFTLCSIPEGEALPRVILEAMATGLPVVATNIAGVPDEVINGETGVLVDPFDRLNFKNAIKDMLNNPESAELMGQKGLCRVKEQFSYEKMFSEIYEIYHKFLKESVS